MIESKVRALGVAIVGSDNKSLFPSLKSIENARLARCAILRSCVEIENWDTKKALRYLFITGGSELIHGAGLGRFCTQWLGDRSDLLAVEGDNSKEDAMWKDSDREVFSSDLKKIVAAVVEVAIHLVMATHIYEFCGHFFLLQDSGPIGLRSTAALAALVMKLWDVAWQQLLKRENMLMIVVFLYDCC